MLKNTDYIKTIALAFYSINGNNLIDKTAERYSFYTVVVFFDEIDKFNEPDNILYQLSRALSHQKIKDKNVALEIIFASN